MLTRRRITALVVALACAVAWVAFVAAGSPGRAAAPEGTTVRASVADDGSLSPDGGGDSQVSGDGRFDIFTTYSSLARGPGNGAEDDDSCGCMVPYSAIYVRDLATGHTDQVSIGYHYIDGPGGASTLAVDQPNGNSYSPSISANGRYISFVTAARNIVSDNGETSTIVVCDRGAPNSSGTFAAAPGEDDDYPDAFQCVSVIASGNFGPTGVPHLDGAGDKLAFIETSFRTKPPTTNTVGYVATLSTVGGQLQTPDAGDMQAVPATIAGYTGPVQPKQIQISSDGDWVVYGASPVATDTDTSATTPSVVAEWNLDGTDAAERVDVDPAGDFIGDANDPVGDADVSDGGTTVVFDANNAETFTSYPDVYAVTVDTSKFSVTGVADATTASVVVSRVQDGTAAGFGGDGAFPTVSADGRYVAFVTDRDGMFDTPAAVFTANSGFSSCLSGTNEGIAMAGRANIRAARRSTAQDASTPTASGSATDRTSRRAQNKPAAEPPGGGFQGSGDGDRTPCQVAVRDLVADHERVTAGQPFVFAHLASPGLDTKCEPGAGQQCNGDGDSENPVSLSDSGAQVGFDSDATDLVAEPNATKDATTNDAFVRTWTPSLEAGSLNFGSVPVGSSSDQSLTLTVNGFGPIPLGPVTVGGTNSGDFTVVSSTCAGVTLHEPDSCVITVEFTPKGTGPRSGTISVQPPATPLVPDPDPIITVPVQGTGGMIPSSSGSSPPPHRTPQFAANPPAVYFGSDIPLHKPGLTRTVTVTNSGTAKLVLTSVSIVAGSIPGAKHDFTVSTPPCASHIQPGGSCTITITFIGHAVGPRNAVLRITDNTTGGLHLITLGGRIRPPTITVNPAVSPTGRVVTVTGTGFAPKRVVELGFLQSGEQAKVRADRKGNFSIGLVVFPNSDEGPRTITSQTVRVDQSISAQTPLLVVLGTLESPTLVIRH